MAEEEKNITISKKNSGFPEWLDFDKLRREGIEYLGKLGGKIWTDHNVHDPGITILEMLCYALLDLGYRTNLPAEDIFARHPSDKTSDNNFFTPSQILSCNPLTITDFRKMLVDIDGVKNAWLEIATDEKDICRPVRIDDPQNPDDQDCIEYLNGLYHVYIDLEKNPDTDFESSDSKKQYLDEVEDRVRKSLMKYRNLCEDFIDIYFLCKQEMGVCADIELEPDADPEKVYINMVEKLRTFFSPSPRYYTLQQLLEKGKPIDEIFAGRPYNIAESHGFIDTEEFEQLRLRKEIHLSDVYNALFEVEGIKSVKQLSLQICRDGNTNPVNGWKFQITELHVPEFSIKCSGFQFSRNEMPVFIDFRKYEGLFQIGFSHNGKILYQQPSPYLDSEIPHGVYRSDLADYYSIQNEFPRVYGIAEGGLPESVSPKRKAQAYQLKAWLLFFDQLLADYLSQLHHMRSLFSLSAATNEQEQQTYFTGNLTNVPDLQKLLRFNVTESNVNPLGPEGTLLVFPVDREALMTLKQQGKLETTDPSNLLRYTFTTKAEQDTIISQVKNDLINEQCEIAYIVRNDECIYYYILTGSDEIALVSRKYFKDKKSAADNAGSVKYIGTFDENYRSFTSEGKFSFNLELNLLSYSKYLQLIVEDRDLFYRRRQDFLNHLLARFAEQFTSYAQLSFGFFSEQELKKKEIGTKELFLTKYDELSANRGKGNDYLANNWNNDNLSGFERRVKAISGITDWKRHSLCNFVVDRYEQQFAVVLKIAGTEYFSGRENFDSNEEALSAAQSLFNAMRDPVNYSTEFIPHDQDYELKIKYAEGDAVYPLRFSSAEAAKEVAGNLSGIFTEKDPQSGVFESAYQFIPVLQDHTAAIVRRAVDVFTSEQEALSMLDKSIKKINDRKKWSYGEDLPSIGNLHRDSQQPDQLIYVDTDAFKIDINDAILGKPEKFTYEMLDRGNNFKFHAAREFDNANLAKSDAFALLGIMSGEKNLEVVPETSTGKFVIHVVHEKEVLARGVMEFNSPEEGKDFTKKIAGIIRSHQYAIVIEKKPHRWKFRYDLGHEKKNMFSFASVDEYNSNADARAAFTEFNGIVSSISLESEGKELLLLPPKSKKNISRLAWTDQSADMDVQKSKQAAGNLLEAEQEIRRLSSDARPEAFRSSVNIDDVSRQGLYVYRLIDKDRVPAFYSMAFDDRDSAMESLPSIVKQSLGQAYFLELCMGGDIIVERKHAVTNSISYRYQVKSRNRNDASGNALILFESVKSYPSRDDAEKAFRENYLDIITLASVKENYGKRISFDEIPIEASGQQPAERLLFVPKQTQVFLGNNADAVADRIISLVVSYPIRKIVFGSAEFNRLFPCDRVEQPVPANCEGRKEKYVYYFTYPSAIEGANKWQSVHYFETPAEAWKEFDFFMILLKYPGNYFVDCDHCERDRSQFRVFIREVLAESAGRFFTKEEAWGAEGVQKFICVSQSKNAFHNYLDARGCCNSFYVACSESVVYHPCKYDTPAKRDEVMLNLYQGISSWFSKKSWHPDQSGGELVLLDGDGKPFAEFSVNEIDQRCLSDRIADLIDLVDEENISEEGGRFVIKNNKGIVLRSLKTDLTKEGWSEVLLDFICYYPIKKYTDERTGKDKYCIEIKLPGFGHCREDMGSDLPCGCGNKLVEDDSPCYLAWKGRCCYATCAEAERALQVILKLLVNYEYYQPIFDCPCGPYGIAIQFSMISAIRDKNLTYYEEQQNISDWFNSELIAVNPQCYPYPELACEAVDRAKRLINSEGLHLVEHILLRPRCFPEDCRCRDAVRNCDETGCEFVWKVDKEDPCTVEEDICFIPGIDPYSFIATIALPAWPERFRKSANRKLLENILYREAPAHVLLRILWLAPHDFCCFESRYKDWNRWLAGKKTCSGDFEVCDFLEFLFDRNYECLEDCNECLPCNEDQAIPVPCFSENTIRLLKDPYLSQLNEIFCWRDQQCGQYEFIECEQEDQVPDDDIILLSRRTNVIQPGAKPPVVAEAREVEPKDVQPKEVQPKKVQPKEVQSKKVQPKKVQSKEIQRKEVQQNETQPKEIPVKPVTAKRRKSQVVNARMSKYRDDVAVVVEKTNENPIAKKAQLFLADPSPEFDRLSKLVDEIIKNKAPKPGEGKALAKTHVHSLLAAGISYYLDKLSFNGKDPERLKEVKKVLDKLRKSGINVKRIYEYLDLSELLEYESDLDENLFRSLFDIK